MTNRLLLALVLPLALAACHDDDEDRPNLPAIEKPVMITCKDACGKRPDIEVERRIARSSDDFCFKHGDCFYNCEGERHAD